MSKDKRSRTAAISVAEEHAQQNVREIELSTGVRVRVSPVSFASITEAMARIEDPPVPEVYDEKRDRWIPNPTDADYIAKRQEAENKRSLAALDTALLMGVELIDGVPDTDTWLPRLELSESLGGIDLSPFDKTNPLHLEFIYKRYVATTLVDMARIDQLMGIDELQIQRAQERFRS